MTSHVSTLGRRAALVSIIATVYFFAATIAARLVNTQYNFLRDYISDYAVGPWGWIYGSAFWASCIGCIALAVALTQSVPPIALSRTGVGLLVIVGVTYAIDFFFPTDILPPGAPPTTIVGAIHLLAALFGWVLFAVGALLVSSDLKSIPYWKPWRGPLMKLSWLSVLLLIVLVMVVASKAPFGGLAEKAFILDRNVWALLLAALIFNSPAQRRNRREASGQKLPNGQRNISVYRYPSAPAIGSGEFLGPLTGIRDLIRPDAELWPRTDATGAVGLSGFPPIWNTCNHRYWSTT
jgi:hypothetical membrane protein